MSSYPDSIYETAESQPDNSLIVCDKRHVSKPRGEFYTRSGLPHLILQTCKACRKQTSREKAGKGIRPAPLVPYTPSEAWAIQRLSDAGIYAAPGKSVSYSYVDVVAFGCVRIEVKSSTLSNGLFKFAFTALQAHKRLMADLIMLICNYEDRKTFHIFPVDAPFFFNEKGERKSGLNFSPGQENPIRHRGRNLLTQPMMDAHRDNYALVWRTLKNISDGLRKAE